MKKGQKIKETILETEKNRNILEILWMQERQGVEPRQ